MEYRAIRTEQKSDSIEHALFGGGRQKGAQNKNHKYIARAWLEGKWRYAYTQAELKILQNWGKNRGTLAGKQQENKLKRESQAAQKQVTQAEKDAKKVTEKAIKDTKKAVSNAATTAKGKANVLAGNAKKTADTLSNKAGKAVYDTKKAAKELANDVKTGVTAKQAKIKAETAINDAKNLPKWAKEDAGKAANAAKSAASKAEAKGKELLDKVTSKAKETSKIASDKAKETAKNVSDKAKETANNAKNYAANVDEKKRKAENDMTQATQDIYNARKQKNEALKKSDEAASSGNRKEAIDQQNKADAASRDERGAKAGFDSAKQQREEATKEQNSLKYKMSDLLSNGSKSKTAQAGKDKAEKLMNDAKSATKEAADKGKSAAEKLANKTEEKLDSAKNKVEQAVNKATNKVYDKVDEMKDKAADAKQKAETKALQKEAEKAYKEEMSKREQAKTEESKESATSKAEAKGKEILDKVRNKMNDAKNKITEAVNKAKEGKKEDTKESESQSTKDQEKIDTSKTNQAKEEPKEEAKETTTQTSNKNEDYDKVDEMGNKILGGKYGHVGHYDQVKRLMDDGYSKEEAELYATYAEKADKLKRSMTADEYKEFKADYDKKRNSEYGKVDEMGSDIRGGKYGNESHDEQVRRMVNDGYSKEEAEYYATYAEAAHKLHRSMTESEYNAFKKDYEAKNGGAIAKISNSNNFSTSSKSSSGSRLTQIDDASEQKLYSENPSYQKASDRASYLGNYIDRIDANGGPKTAEAKESYNQMKRELFSLENKINAFRQNYKVKNK